MHPKKFENLLKVSAKERYGYFVKMAAGYEHFWGLYNDGWAMMSPDAAPQQRAIAVWPEIEFAELMNRGEWEHFHYKVTQIDVREFLTKILPDLKKSGVGVAVFPTPEGSVYPTLDELEAHLNYELWQIE
jgi:Protein of unknown function (DUF2750)